MIGLLMFEKNMHESSTRSSPFTLVFSYVKRKSSKEQMYRDFDQKPWNVNGKSCKAKPCKLLFKESFRHLFMRGGRAKIKKSGKSPKYYYYYYYFLFCTPNIGISNIYTNKPIKFLRIACTPILSLKSICDKIVHCTRILLIILDWIYKLTNDSSIFLLFRNSSIKSVLDWQILFRTIRATMPFF